jgi:leader peptidase (prepilin peptidase) / N-methyltransferase
VRRFGHWQGQENHTEMTAALDALVFVFGLIVGSFLNVVIYRVPRGESIVKPRSRCPGCGHEIREYDNIPVISWLVLRGRCRDCHEPISARYPAVELFTGLIFLVMALHFGTTWELPAYLYFAAIGVALAMIDFDVKRLPNAIVLPSYVVAGALLLLPAALDGQWADYLRAWEGAAALYLFFFIVRLIYPAGMGFGDVKFAFVVGMYLGYLGWGVLVIGAFSGFLIGGLVGIVVMLLPQPKDEQPVPVSVGSDAPAGDADTEPSAESATTEARPSRRSKRRVPFGPFMVIGAWVGILWGQALWNAYMGTMPGN